MFDSNASPITPREAYSGEYWRSRARLTRDKVGDSIDARTRASLEKVASEYEKLADRADNIQREMIAHELGLVDPSQLHVV